MFDWVQNAPLLVLFLGFFTSLVVCSKNDERGYSRGWRFTFVLLSVALCFELGLLQTRIAPFDGHRVFDGNPILNYLGAVVLLFSTLNHLNFHSRFKIYSSEVFSLEIALALCGFALARANHLFVLLLLLPLVFLMISAAPSVLLKQRSSHAVYAGLSRAMILVILLALSISLFENGLKTLWIHEMQKMTIQKEQQSFFWLGWALLGAAVATFFVMPLLQFFTEDYEKAESWALWGYFAMFAPLVGAILVLRLFVLLQSENLLNLLRSTFGAQALPGLGLNLFLLFGALGVLQTFFYRQVVSLSSAFLLQPLLLLILGVGVGTKATLSWGLVALGVFVLAVPLFARLMSVLKCPLQSNLDQLAQRVSEGGSIRRIELFLLFLFLTPVSQFPGFEMLSNSVANLSQTAKPFDGSSESFLVLGILSSSLFFGSALMFFIARVFSGSTQQNSGESLVVGPRISWDYILLIPFIILGIYPAPLYNYLVNALKFLTWIP